MKRILGLLVLFSVPVFAQVRPDIHAMCVPCQTCNDILTVGTKIDMVYGVYDYSWEFACGEVKGQLSADRKKISLSVPDCCKVRVCRKAGTDCDTSGWLSCGQDAVYGVSNGKELSHVSIEAATCCTPPTPTPPTPTATPTPPPPTRTPTATPTATPPPTPCVPTEDCGSRCGNAPDGCGGTIWCGNCPPPPPPPGRWPEANCETCAFPYVLSIYSWQKANVWHGEWFYFMNENVVRQIVLQAFDDSLYSIMVGGQEPKDAKKIFEFQGPGSVTIPYPLAGLAIQQWTHLYTTGGSSRMTIWLDSKNSVIIKTDELKAVIVE